MKIYYLNFRNTLDCITSRLDTAEGNISELEERNRNNSTWSTESETKRPVLQWLEQMSRHLKHVRLESQEEGAAGAQKKYMKKHLLHLMKTKSHMSKKSMKKTTWSHITINLLKTNDKEKILIVARGKRHSPKREKQGDSRRPVRDTGSPRWWGSIFKIQKEKHYLLVYTQKNYFQKWRWNKDFQTAKTERIHHQHICNTRNIKGNSLDRRKKVPDENLDLYQGMTRSRDGNYMGTYEPFLFVL